MADRKLASLSKGTLVDYASPARIRSLFGDDMSKIRSEYSRQRSILRKRMERMEKAGETFNRAFERFGDVKTQLPTIRELTDQQVLEMLSRTAQQIGGGYQGTVSEIRASRKDAQEALKAQAESMGDEDLADALDKPLTPRQYERMQRLMGMIQKMIGKNYTSDEVRTAALKEVLNGKGKESLLTKASRALESLGFDTDNNGEMLAAKIKEQYTAKGTVRVSWSKAHGKRGK